MLEENMENKESKSAQKFFQRFLNMSMRNKLMTVNMILIFLCIFILTFYFRSRTSSMMYDELEERARAVSGIISQQAQYGIALGDRDALYLIIEAALQWSDYSEQNLAQTSLNQDIISRIKNAKNVSYIIIVDTDGNILASFNEADFKIDSEKKAELLTAKSTQFERYRLSGLERVIHATSPIFLRQESSTEGAIMEESFFEEEPSTETTVAQAPEAGRIMGFRSSQN